MKNLTIFFLLGSCLTFFSCSKNNDQESNPELDQIFQLKIGETAVFANQDISVQPVSIIEDNRCPALANCIIAGWVTVSFDVTIEDVEYLFQVTLDPEKPQSAEAETGEYTFRLVTVNPYPQNSDGIDQEEYSFSVVVEQ